MTDNENNDAVHQNQPTTDRFFLQIQAILPLAAFLRGGAKNDELVSPSVYTALQTRQFDLAQIFFDSSRIYLQSMHMLTVRHLQTGLKSGLIVHNHSAKDKQ